MIIMIFGCFGSLSRQQAPSRKKHHRLGEIHSHRRIHCVELFPSFYTAMLKALASHDPPLLRYGFLVTSVSVSPGGPWVFRTMPWYFSASVCNIWHHSDIYAFGEDR